jgi:Zn-finger nucleic acid-binding protein
MKCPICTDSTLVMADRHGIEIDYCPTCRGVWLDRGELDKIIERAAGSAAVAPAPAAAPQAVAPAPAPSPMAPSAPSDPRWQPAPPPASRPWESPDSSARYGHGHGHRRKRRGFLDELFDF